MKLNRKKSTSTHSIQFIIWEIALKFWIVLENIHLSNSIPPYFSLPQISSLSMNPLLKLSLRGHKSSVSCIARVQDDLVSADRDGWVVLWNLTTKRPRALWKAHQGQILTLKYTAMGLLTHGRDSELRLWNLSESSLRGCSSDVSVVGNEEEPKKPQYEELRSMPWTFVM